jgi:outer membrane protein assembly factor BamB
MVLIPQGFDSDFVWSKKISKNGMLINKPAGQNFLDVIDIQGRYFAVNPENGNIHFTEELPGGTITDFYSQDNLVFAGYDSGLLICLDKKKKKLLWSRNYSDQIFSLRSNGRDLLVITTSAKRLYCIQANSGGILSETVIQTTLVNKPTVTKNGYWLGTVEPALEKRNFNNKVLQKFSLTGPPGNPVIADSLILISTFDGFITSFPNL